MGVSGIGPSNFREGSPARYGESHIGIRTAQRTVSEVMPRQASLAPRAVGVLVVYSVAACRPLLDPHSRNGSATARARHLAGPCGTRVLLGLAHEAIEVAERLAESPARVARPPGLAEQQGGPGVAIRQQLADPPFQRHAIRAREPDGKV